METKNKKTSTLVFYILGFVVAVFFELYWISNFPYDYFMLIGIGLVVLIMGYLTFDGIIKAYNEAQEIRREQNEIMIKAQKAIYLATKKSSAEAENMQVQSLKAVNILMDRMVENLTQKQIEAKSDKPADLSGLISELTESNARLAKEVQNAITVNQLVKANEDLIRNVQDVLSGRTDVNIPVSSATVNDAPSKTSDISASEALTGDVSEEVPIETSDIFSDEDEILIEDISKEDSAKILDSTMLIRDISEDTSEDASEEDDEDASEEDDDTINIDDFTLEELDEMDEMDSDIAYAEAAVAAVTQNVEAMEAAEELELSMAEETEMPDLSVTTDTEAPDLSMAEETELPELRLTEEAEEEEPELFLTDDEEEVTETPAATAPTPEKGPNDALTSEEIAALFAKL